jgi:hypothetical protein
MRDAKRVMQIVDGLSVLVLVGLLVTWSLASQALPPDQQTQPLQITMVKVEIAGVLLSDVTGVDGQSAKVKVPATSLGEQYLSSADASSPVSMTIRGVGSTPKVVLGWWKPVAEGKTPQSKPVSIEFLRRDMTTASKYIFPAAIPKALVHSKVNTKSIWALTIKGTMVKK